MHDGMQAHRQKARQAGRQAGRQLDRHTQRHTHRDTHTEIHTHTHNETPVHVGRTGVNAVLWKERVNNGTGLGLGPEDLSDVCRCP